MKKTVSFWGQKKILNYLSKSRNKYDDLYLGEKILLNNFFKKKTSVLDIGCSQGGFVSILRSINRDFKYLGFDFNQKAISIAKKKYPLGNFKKINDNNYSKYTNKKYDLVIIFGILHLNKDWKKIVTEAFKVTKKHLIFDLRETDKEILKKIMMKIKGDKNSIPYFVHHEKKIKNFFYSNFKKRKLIKISYKGKPTKYCNYKSEIIFSNYCLYK